MKAKVKRLTSFSVWKGKQIHEMLHVNGLSDHRCQYCEEIFHYNYDYENNLVKSVKAIKKSKYVFNPDISAKLKTYENTISKLKNEILELKSLIKELKHKNLAKKINAKLRAEIKKAQKKEIPEVSERFIDLS